MASKARKIILFIWIVLNVPSTIPIFGFNLTLLEKIGLSSQQKSLLKACDFCVTDDELFIIPDYQEGNIKVYEKNEQVLKLVKIIGRKGYGPNEFARPTLCFYNKDENKFGVMDHGIRKIFIYDRIGRIEFKRIKEVSCLRGACDIQSVNNRLFISGFISGPNGNPYDFYSIDLTNGQIAYLLPSYHKYGLKSFREYGNQYRGKRYIPSIGIRAFFDIYRDDAYFVWEGNLKVIKLNVVSGVVDPKDFGMQPPHYIKPYAPQLQIEGRCTENVNLKMSFVRKIFAAPKYVLVIYEGPTKTSSISNFKLQFYTLCLGSP